MGKSKPKLTIAMCTYDDFNGVYFTIQSIRLYHPEVLNDVEFLVIDNNPEGKQGKEVKKFIEESVPSGTYVPFKDYTGCLLKSKLFDYANAPAVLCIDCHVLLYPNSIKKLIQYYDDNPETKDLLHGPLLWEQLEDSRHLKDGNKVKSISTHFDIKWRGGFWGVWENHESLGYHLEDPPFEIPAQGTGLFSCRKDAWLGFNEHFREFGGEEVYIHEKFRRNGAKVLCLPFMRWMHRFYRPEGPPYPLSNRTKIRNYLIGHMELNIILDELLEHFVDEERLISERDMKSLMLQVMDETGYKPKIENTVITKRFNPFVRIEI